MTAQRPARRSRQGQSDLDGRSERLVGLGWGPVPSKLPRSIPSRKQCWIGSMHAKFWQNFVEFTLKFVQGSGMITQSYSTKHKKKQQQFRRMQRGRWAPRLTLQQDAVLRPEATSRDRPCGRACLPRRRARIVLFAWHEPRAVARSSAHATARVHTRPSRQASCERVVCVATRKHALSSAARDASTEAEPIIPSSGALRRHWERGQAQGGTGSVDRCHERRKWPERSGRVGGGGGGRRHPWAPRAWFGERKRHGGGPWWVAFLRGPRKLGPSGSAVAVGGWRAFDAAAAG